MISQKAKLAAVRNALTRVLYAYHSADLAKQYHDELKMQVEEIAADIPEPAASGKIGKEDFQTSAFEKILPMFIKELGEPSNLPKNPTQAYRGVLEEFRVYEARVEAGIKTFGAELDAGEQGLISKYGPTADLKDLQDWSQNSGFQEMEHSGKKYQVPIATVEQVSFMEKWIRATCAPYELHIGEMTAEELEAFNWNHFMAQDYNRGKMPGQVIPPRIFRHSEEFKRWEESILDKTYARSKETEE